MYDCLQSIYLKVIEYDATIAKAANIRGYLCKLIRNEVREYGKKSKSHKSESIGKRDISYNDNDIDANIILDSLYPLLSNTERELIELRLQNYKMSEIADKLNISLSTSFRMMRSIKNKLLRKIST